MPDANNWLFQIGLARCGTSGLAKIVSAHKNACVFNEAYLWQFTELLCSERIFPGANSIPINMFRAKSRFGIDKFKTSMLREFFEGIRNSMEVQAGVPFDIFGGKATHLYHKRMQNIQKVFPNCRLLYISRNIYDQMASFVHTNWWRREVRGIDKRVKDAEGIAVSTRKNNDLLEILNNPTKYNLHKVAFEDIANKPKDTIRGILDFLELDEEDYDWSVLDRIHFKQAMGHADEIPQIKKMKEDKKHG